MTNRISSRSSPIWIRDRNRMERVGIFLCMAFPPWAGHPESLLKGRDSLFPLLSPVGAGSVYRCFPQNSTRKSGQQKSRCPEGHRPCVSIPHPGHDCPGSRPAGYTSRPGSRRSRRRSSSRSPPKPDKTVPELLLGHLRRYFDAAVYLKFLPHSGSSPQRVLTAPRLRHGRRPSHGRRCLRSGGRH